MNKRNTKQKEIILDVLKENRIHPTISEICELVKRKDQSIGQATVYRYIHNLLKENKIKQICVNNDTVRYDIGMDFHYHLKCSNCSKIIDLFEDKNKIKDYLESKYNIKVDNINLVIDGKCEECSSEI